MIKLGQKVKDKVSGFTGIAVSKVEYMNGCVQFQVVRKMRVKDTDYPTGVYFDVEQLDVVGDGKALKINKRKKQKEIPSGGVRSIPLQRY